MSSLEGDGIADPSKISPSPIVLLVDYDNVKPIANEQSTADVANNLLQIREWLSKTIGQLSLPVSEVSLRLYGGWNDERGNMTSRGNWVLASLSHVRGLLNGVRYMPSVPTSIAARSLRLRGLYRTNRAKPEQKMVDTLMAVDLLHFCASGHPVVGLVSDDDDLVPALLYAVETPRVTCCLFRIRDKGTGINDALLESRSVQILKLVI